MLISPIEVEIKASKENLEGALEVISVIRERHPNATIRVEVSVS